MSISRADVVKVSLLARLQLTDEQLNEMTEQLGQIVGYVEQLIGKLQASKQRNLGHVCTRNAHQIAEPFGLF